MATNSPARKPKSQSKQGAVVQMGRQFSGPIPPPDALQGYEQVLPGSAERILVMDEKEQAHRFEHDSERMSLENKELAQNGNAILRAQVLGFLAIFCCLLCAFLSAYFKFSDYVTVTFLSIPVFTVIKQIFSVAQKQTK